MSQPAGNSKNLLIIIGAVVVILGSAFAIYRTQFAAPKFNLPLHRAVAGVMAERSEERRVGKECA